MEPQYKTSVMFNGQKIIPSDTFSLDNNTYMLLDILHNPLSGDSTLHIVGTEGDYIGKEYTFSLSEMASLSTDLLRSKLN
jgi:hypothetical protein